MQSCSAWSTRSPIRSSGTDGRQADLTETLEPDRFADIADGLRLAARRFGTPLFVTDVATLSESNVAPTLRLMDGAANPVPVRRLTDVGGNDIGWSKNGTLLSYALGSTLFLYDVARGDSLARLAGVDHALAFSFAG